VELEKNTSEINVTEEASVEVLSINPVTIPNSLQAMFGSMIASLQASFKSEISALQIKERRH
jgi:hypothetical protein